MAKKTTNHKRVWRVTLELVEQFDVVTKSAEGIETPTRDEKAVTLCTKERDIDASAGTADANMDAIIASVTGPAPKDPAPSRLPVNGDASAYVGRD